MHQLQIPDYNKTKINDIKIKATLEVHLLCM